MEEVAESPRRSAVQASGDFCMAGGLSGGGSLDRSLEWTRMTNCLQHVHTLCGIVLNTIQKTSTRVLVRITEAS